MRHYETVFILDPAVSDERTAEEIEKAKSVISSAAGEVIEVQRWGKRKLAYEIKKKREGIYTLVRFKGTGAVVSELERSFRLSEPVIRFLTIMETGPPAEVKQEAAGEGASAEQGAGVAQAEITGRPSEVGASESVEGVLGEPVKTGLAGPADSAPAEDAPSGTADASPAEPATDAGDEPKSGPEGSELSETDEDSESSK